jgi:ribosomal protein S18 acetylase RimI-like enzyme
MKSDKAPAVVRATLAHLDLVAPLFDAFLRERLERDESVVFLALENERGLGFTQLYPTFTSIGARRAWILNDLYVDPTARRKGIGRMLMEAARAFAVETEAAWLELATAKDNHVAQALYRSLGYKLDEKYERFKLTM